MATAAGPCRRCRSFRAELVSGGSDSTLAKKPPRTLFVRKAESVFDAAQPIIAGARIRIWVGAIFWVPSEQTLERQILARVTFAPELGFIDSG